MAEIDTTIPADDQPAFSEPSDGGIKKIERLLDLMREGHRQRIDSIRRIDDKATRYLTVLGFTSVIFSVEARIALDSFLPPRGVLDWLSLTLLLGVVIVVGFALFAILKVIAVHELKFLEANEDLITTFTGQSELDALSGTIFFFRDADLSNQTVATEKLKNINRGFDLTIVSLVLSLLAVTATSIDVAVTKSTTTAKGSWNSFTPFAVDSCGDKFQTSKSMDTASNQPKSASNQTSQITQKPHSGDSVLLNPNAKRPQGGVLSESKVPKPPDPKK
ncbi:MAG TPA: hypothetical protein VGM92_05380 [Candidatus Kapabacteria bacterium]